MTREPPGRPDLDEAHGRRIALVGGLVLVLALGIIFVIQNSRSVRVSFVFFSAQISLIWVIVLSALAGAAIGAIVTRLVRRRLRGE